MSLRYVGGKISPEMQAPKLAWLARHMPETFAKAGHFFDLTDFLTFRATGSLTRSVCPATCKFGYLAHEKRWPDDFFDSIGLGFLDDDGYARIGAEIGAAGRAARAGLTAEAAAAMGLAAGDAGRRGADRRPCRRRGHARRAAGGEPADPRRRLALILGTSSSCMALSDEPRFVDGRLGSAFRRADPRPMAHRRRPVGVRRRRSTISCGCIRPSPTSGARRAARAAALEKEIVARAGGLSQAALLAEGLHVLPDFIGSRRRRPIRARAAASSGSTCAKTREPAGALCRRALRPRLWPRRDRRAARAVRLRLRFDRRQRRRGAQRRWCARSSPTRAARRSKRRRRRSRCCWARRCSARSPRGRRRLASAMSVDVALARARGAGGRGDRRVPRAQAPRLRIAAPGRAGDSRARPDRPAGPNS